MLSPDLSGMPSRRIAMTARQRITTFMTTRRTDTRMTGMKARDGILIPRVGITTLK
jgi:hypothetical protein